jgi:4-amino-4-deoxy-L-arabinose transferase-like glycosyltransferase
VPATVLAAVSWSITIAILVRIPHLGRVDSYATVALGWVVASLCWLAAVWQLAPPAPSASGSSSIRQGRWQAWAVALVVLGAFVLRLGALGSVPFTFSGDEANHGLEAVKVLSGEIRNPFGTGWFSMPTMYFFLQSVSLAIFGPSVFGVRFPSACVGTLAVATTFFLVRRLAGRQAALATALAVATYHVHVHFSRIGLNNIADTLVVSAALLFASRALSGTRRRLLDWAAIGCMCALALYAYPGARVVMVVVPAVLALQVVSEPRRFWRSRGAGIATALVSFLVVGAPMLQCAARFPADFHGRMNQAGIVQSGWLAEEVARTGSSVGAIVFDQFRRAVLAFNYYPDRRDVYGLEAPLLDPVSGTLFLLGLGYALVAALARRRDRRLALMVVWWWAAMLLGGMLTETPPAIARLVTLTIPTCFFIVLALQRVLGAIRGALLPRLPVDVTVLAAVAVFGASSVLYYFADYSPRRVFGGPHAELATILAPVFQDHQRTHDVAFLGPPFMYWGFPTMTYLAPEVHGTDVGSPLTEPPPSEWRVPGRGLFIVVLPQRLDELEWLRRTFSEDTVVTEIRSEGTAHGFLGSVYEVPP